MDDYTLKLNGEAVDALFTQLLHDLGETQMWTIKNAAEHRFGDSTCDWEAMKDAFEVLGAVNRLLEYYGKPVFDPRQIADAEN